MNRKEFLRISALGAAAAIAGPALASCVGTKSKPAAGDTDRRAEPLNLKISFQENTAPGETLGQRLDWMEAHGVAGLEPWGVRLWERVDELKSALAGRNIAVSAICAGFEGFILAENEAEKKAFDDSIRRIIAAAGQLGSTGVIMVPAFNAQTPCRAHTLATRDFLVEEMRKLGDFALQHGTTVMLEPLNRREAFYLRQVSDAAAIARDSGSEGVKVVADFWHMSEETNDYAALLSASKWLSHMHIASRAERVMPGEDAAADIYLDGFRALKELNFGGYLGFECGSRGDRNATVPAALDLLRRQWDEV